MVNVKMEMEMVKDRGPLCTYIVCLSSCLHKRELEIDAKTFL